MKILNYFNTTKEEVEAKKFNIIIGISLGNKYFSNKENVKEFILWALENSVNDVVVLIPDKIHTINYEIRSGYSKEKAERATHKKSADTKKMVEEMTATLSEKDRARIAILTWEDIENDPNYPDRMARKINNLVNEIKNQKINFKNSVSLSELLKIFEKESDLFMRIVGMLSYRGPVQIADILDEKVLSILMFNLSMLSKNCAIYLSAISQTEMFSIFALFSNLSSPVSAAPRLSPVMCPTSVRFITQFTLIS